MTPEARRLLAEGLIKAMRDHVAAKVAPLDARLTSTEQMLVDALLRIEALEAKLAELEGKTLRRVA